MVKQYLEVKSSRLGMFRVSVDGKEFAPGYIGVISSR